MHLAIAECAHFGPASGALCIFSSLRCMYVRGSDPFATFQSWTVDSILRVILMVLTIPENLEFGIE